MDACSFSSSRLCARIFLSSLSPARVDALVVRIDRFELFHDRDHRAVSIDGLGLEDCFALVQGTAAAGH